MLVAGIERTQIVGSPDPKGVRTGLKSQGGAKASDGGDVCAGVGGSGGENRDVGAEIAGIGEIEDGLTGAGGEAAGDPRAIHDHHGPTAIGLRSGNDQIEDAVVVDIGDQHGGTEVLSPAGGRIGLDQQAAHAALVESIIEQRQVGGLGGEVGAGQRIEPGGGGIGRITAHGSAHTGAECELAGVVDPHPPGGIAGGIGGARLGDRQPAVLGAAVAVGVVASHLGHGKAGGRGIVSHGILTAEDFATIYIFQLQGRLFHHGGGGQGLAVVAAGGVQLGREAVAEAERQAGGAAAGDVADGAGIGERKRDLGGIGQLGLQFVAIATVDNLPGYQQVERRGIGEECVIIVGVLRQGLQPRQRIAAQHHLPGVERAGNRVTA